MAATQNFSKKSPEVERLHINLAKLKRNGRKFEIVVDPDKAVDYKAGRIENISEVLVAEHIFEDAQKGVFSPEQDLKTAFPGMDTLQVAELILKKGELQLSSKYRDGLQEEKRRRIIEIIHQNGINPKNNLPHPVIRIENAFAEAKIRIDDKKSAEDQVQGILKKLQAVMPIRFEHKHLQIHISANYAKKYYKLIHSYGKIMKDEWLDDGCYFCVIEVPAGLYTDLIDELSKKTHGGVEIKILSEKDSRYYE
jgi:ribosome maturation protein SDO1